jgi:predicted permease
MFAEWMRQLRTWLSRSRFEEELDEEMQFHRDMRQQELRETGLPPDEAKRQAIVSFGSTVNAREASNESWGLAWLDSLNQDLRYGLRQLNRNRGFAATAILTIALGVGASAAIFTLINAVLLRPLPYPEPDRVVVLNQDLHSDHRLQRTPDLDLHHMKDKFQSFSAIGSRGRSGANWQTSEGIQSLMALHVDPDLLDLLGFQPVLGRSFTAQDEQEGGNVVILTYATWLSRFGGDPAAIGSTMALSDGSFTIVGVAPPEFRVDWEFPSPAEIYTLVSRFSSYHTNNEGLNRWGYVARLRPGVSLEEARVEFGTAYAAWLANQPSEWLRPTPEVRLLSDEAFEYFGPKLWTLAGAGAFVFLIVCANLAGLLLARSVARRREIGVRASLGAARFRIARQLSVEAALLAFFGGAIGFVLCSWVFYGFKSILHFYLPRLEQASISPATLLFAAGASVLCAALGGMIPLLARSFSSPWNSLRSDASGTDARRKGRRTADVLVVVQFALSLALIVGAGLLTRSFWNLMQTDWGFDGDGLIAVMLQEPSEIRNDARALSALADELAERVASVSGVGDVSLSPGPPVRGFMNSQEIIVGEDMEDLRPKADLQPVAANYFELMRIPLLRGRPLLDSDDEGSPRVAVIDKTFAQRYWPDSDPLGQSFELRTEDGFQPTVIVGVARRIFRNMLQNEAFPIAYLPYRQYRMHSPTVMLRSSQDLGVLIPAIRRATADLAQKQRIDVWTVAEQMDYSYAEPRFYMALLSAFALLALTLAAVGLYGVIAYSVRARTAEIGLRLAVGAAPGQVLRMVLRRGIRLAAIGLVLGAALAWAGVRSIEGMLFGVSAADPLTIAGVCLLLFATALLASWIPASRAASIEPVTALRSE